MPSGQLLRHVQVTPFRLWILNDYLLSISGGSYGDLDACFDLVSMLHLVMHEWFSV